MSHHSGIMLRRPWTRSARGSSSGSRFIDDWPRGADRGRPIESLCPRQEVSSGPRPAWPERARFFGSKQGVPNRDTAGKHADGGEDVRAESLAPTGRMAGDLDVGVSPALVTRGSCEKSPLIFWAHGRV